MTAVVEPMAVCISHGSGAQVCILSGVWGVLDCNAHQLMLGQGRTDSTGHWPKAQWHVGGLCLGGDKGEKLGKLPW